ncbi:MAG: hypothetical protein A2583_16265 [Bdellovibrionales bacterium RIFOXYD1_FULL_53_11]|nr:MAG: hypothetical protein A2583_16265 [Bdellovibrionales bacterium RIFOXYD1_FULL_53_11]
MNAAGLPAMAVVLAALVSFSAGCAGRNIHKNLKADPKLLVRKWVFQTHGPFLTGDRGVEYSNPILVEGALVFGNSSTGLVSIYPKTLQTRWVLPVPEGVISELAHEKGSVFFGGGDGFLYCVNADNGRVLWRYDLHNPMVSQPTLSAGRLFVTTTDDTIYAFDAGTGKWLWHYKRRSAQSSTIFGASAPLVDGSEVLAGLSDGYLVALSINDGQLKWERKLHFGAKFTDVDAHPVLENGIIYIPSYDGVLYALKRQNGEVIWRFDAGGSKRVHIDGEKIYFGSSDGSIYAIQKNNAKQLWKFEMDGGAPTQMVVTDKHLIVGSSFQYLYMIDKNTGLGVYRYNAGDGSGFSGTPAYDQNVRRLYLLSGAGNLYAFMLRTPIPNRPHVLTDAYD